MLTKEFLQNLSYSYKELIPVDVEAGTLITALKKRVDLGEIEEEFSQLDFHETLVLIQEVLLREQTIQNESISKKLSKNFYTTVKIKGEYRYKLTQYAKNFASLLEDRINMRLTNISLFKTLKNAIALKVSDLETVDDLEVWYEIRFLGKPQQIVMAHVEQLQHEVAFQTEQLRQILNTTDDPILMIKSYLSLFSKLGKRSEELSETLQYKEEIFEFLTVNSQHLTLESDTWNRYKYIEEQVENFFDEIDSFLSVIEDRIQESVKKLRNLLDSVRYKQVYKVRIEKFMAYIFSNATKLNSNHWELPSEIPSKSLLNDEYILTSLPEIEYEVIEEEAVDNEEVDEKYQEEQNVKALERLERQEKVYVLTEEIWNKLSKTKKIEEFHTTLIEILNQENDWEVALEVASDVVKKVGNTKNVEIELNNKDFVSPFDNIVLWKMKIQRSNS